MILLLFLSFFLSKIKVSGFCARCFSVVLLFENRNFFRETEKILQQKNKKEEKHFLKHILRSNFLQYCCNESTN